MQLTAREQRVLAEIEHNVEVNDPAFARGFGHPAASPPAEPVGVWGRLWRRLRGTR